MLVKLNDLLNCLDKIAPFGLAESWDNVGLLIGDPEKEVRSVLLGLDPTLSLLKEAVSCGADTIITHHPCIFRPLPFVHTSSPDGAFLELALAKKINVIACHTNFDSATPGVSDALAMLLGLNELAPLRRISSTEDESRGLGRIGSYVSPLSFEEFMQKVFSALELKTVMVAGTPPEKVRTVAMCGGSGSDLIEEAFSKDADVYLSAEIKHSSARWAEEIGFCVIDGTHYATEYPAMALLKKQLESQVLASSWDIQIVQSRSEKPVFNTLYKNDF